MSQQKQAKVLSTKKKASKIQSQKKSTTKKVQKMKSIHKKQQSLPKELVSAPVPRNPNLRSNVTVRAKFDPISLNLAYASWYGYMASRGVFVISEEEGNDPNVMVGGFGFMFNGFVSAIGSGTMELTQAPQVVLDMFAALTSKDVNFLTYGKAGFSWLDSPSWSNNPIINVAGGVWTPLVVVNDSNSYDSLANIPGAVYNIQNYSALLNKIGGINGTPKLKISPVASYKSELSRDVSSFARVYVYNGLTPSEAGGYYKDVENEVTITAPMLSSFAQYFADQNIEARVPTKLHAYSGDAAVSAGWALHPTFVSYFNKRSPAFKCIDFDWICYTITAWMSLCVEKAVSLGNWRDGLAIGISYQDFTIILRQALLNVFDSQYMVQFTGPMQFSGQENGFVPFQVNGNSFGAQQFSTMLIPELLQENLASLKARTIRSNNVGKSKINTQTFIPVLGRYVQDSLPVPQYKTQDGTFVPLFDPTIVQTSINLINGQIGQNSFVNLNGTYYQTALSFWAEAVNSIKAVSTSITSIVGDQGPMGLGTLYYTSVVKTIEGGPTLQAPRVLRSPFLDLIENNRIKEPPPKAEVRQLKRVDSQNAPVKALPPAQIITETQCNSTAALPPSAEMQALLDSLIVPVIRLDPNGTSDQLSLQMYQIEVKEPLSTKSDLNVNIGGGGIVTRLSKLASLCVTGVGHDSGGEYDRIMQHLKDHNNAGMLSGLLGGLAKTFLPPDAHGIVDVVADVLPF